MASKYWIKLYHEILDDPKMGQLSDRLWRRAVEFFLMAGDVDEDGRLPSPSDMAWRLRISEEELIQDLQALSADGIEIVEHVDWTEDWVVTKFEDRQGPVSDVERQRQSRDRRRKEEYYGNEEVTQMSQDGNEGVTKCDENENHENVEAEIGYLERIEREYHPSHVSVTLRETDTDTEVDTDTETDKKQTTTEQEAEKKKNVAAVKILLSDFGVEEPWLSDLAMTCPEQDVKDWIAYVKGRWGVKNPTGFLISRLRTGESPPVTENPDRWFTGDDFKKFFVQPGELPEEESDATEL